MCGMFFAPELLLVQSRSSIPVRVTVVSLHNAEKFLDRVRRLNLDVV